MPAKGRKRLALREVHKRRFRDRFSDHAPVAALDIGASKVSCYIAHHFGDDDSAPEVDIIGVGHHGLTLRETRAPTAECFEKSIRAAVDSAEHMAGERINKLTVAVNGRYLRARRIGVDLEIAGGVITAEDVAESLREGMGLAAGEGFAPLHAFPIVFRVDGEESFADPTGFTGDFLSTELISVSARQSVLDNLTTLLERCGLRVEAFVAAPYAAGEATLLDDEKELGVVLIDIGANSAGFAVFDNGALIDIGGVAVGGGHITKDIAKIFGAPLTDAERAKTMHGGALCGPDDEHRFVEFSQLGVGGEALRASRADLIDVITPRLEEIFELIAEKLPDTGPHGFGVRRAVICGGGAQLVGAREVAERVLRMKARIGRPSSIAGAPEAVTGPGFAVCAGVVLHVAKLNSGRGSVLGLETAAQSRYAGPLRLVGGVEAWLRARF